MGTEEVTQALLGITGIFCVLSLFIGTIYAIANDDRSSRTERLEEKMRDDKKLQLKNQPANVPLRIEDVGVIAYINQK